MPVREHLTKHYREIAAIRKLILAGMKMIHEMQVEFRASHRSLEASQRETDRQLHLLIRSLRGSSNGHSRRRVD